MVVIGVTAWVNNLTKSTLMPMAAHEAKIKDLEAKVAQYKARIEGLITNGTMTIKIKGVSGTKIHVSVVKETQIQELQHVVEKWAIEKGGTSDLRFESLYLSSTDTIGSLGIATDAVHTDLKYSCT